MHTFQNIPFSIFAYSSYVMKDVQNPHICRNTHTLAVASVCSSRTSSSGQFHCLTQRSEGADSSALAHWPRHQRSAPPWHPSASIIAPHRGGHFVFAGQQVECSALQADGGSLDSFVVWSNGMWCVHVRVSSVGSVNAMSCASKCF